MELEVEEVDPRVLYRTITSVVVPRPIGWISSLSETGTENLAPYSFFNAVSSKPPVVMFSASKSAEKGLKDTPKNVLETGEFVFNLVTEDLTEPMDRTSAPLERGESEFEFADIGSAESTVVEPPRVADASVALECTVYDSLDVYDNTVVFGEAVYLHIDDALLTDGKVDSRKVNAIARLGGPYYGGIDVLEYTRKF